MLSISQLHIAVIGASQRENSLGERIFSAMLHTPFAGTLTPVNPRHKTIAGISAFSQVNKIPSTIDIAIIVSPEESHESVVTQCIKKKIPHNFIILREPPSPAQINVLQKLVEQTRHAGIYLHVLSANGISIPAQGLYATLQRPLPASGNTAIIGTRHDFCAEITHHLQHLPIGYSFLIDYSKEFANPVATLNYLANDANSKLIIAQLPEHPTSHFFSAIRHLTHSKPLILHHNGNTCEQEKAILAHIAQRCNAYLTYTPSELEAAVHAAMMPSEKYNHNLQIISDHEQGWLHHLASQHRINLADGIIIPRHTGTLAARDIVATELQNDDCQALLVSIQSNSDIPHQIKQLHTDKPFYIITAQPSQLNHFPHPEAALHTIAASQKWLKIKRVQHKIAKPRLSSSAFMPSENMPSEKNSNGSLHYRVHEKYGAWLQAEKNGQTFALLPPFTTSRARQLAAFFGSKKLQAQLEQILFSLNQSPTLHSATYILSDGIIKQELAQYDSQAVMQLFSAPPTHHNHSFTLKNGESVHIRAVYPEDAEALQYFVRNLSEQARKTRFMTAANELAPAQLARFSNIDYQREAAFIAEQNGEILGWAQYGCTTYPETCTFGISVASQAQRQGLAKHLMQTLIQYARESGYQNMDAEILANNQAMLNLAGGLGFQTEISPADSDLYVANLIL